MLSAASILAFLASPLLLLKEKEAPAPVVKPLPFSREDLIAWLEGQNPEQPYNFFDIRDCMWGRYTAGMGGLVSGRTYQINTPGGVHVMDAEVDVLGTWEGKVAIGVPRTLGGALHRARTYQ